MALFVVVGIGSTWVKSPEIEKVKYGKDILWNIIL